MDVNHLLDCPGDVSGKQHLAAAVSAALQLAQPRCSIPVDWGFLWGEGPWILSLACGPLVSSETLPRTACTMHGVQAADESRCVFQCLLVFPCYDDDDDSRDPARGLGTGWNLDRIGRVPSYLQHLEASEIPMH